MSNTEELELYDKIEEVIKNDYVKLLQCFSVWKEVNKYYDERTPEDCKDFHDYTSLIYCIIAYPQYTQHLFDFELNN